MTVGIYDNRYACWNGCPANPGHVGVGLKAADANGFVVSTRTGAAYIDVVTARIEIETGLVAHSNVVAAIVARVRKITDGCIVVTVARAAAFPRAVLLIPVVLPPSAPLPITVLPLPVMLLRSALVPLAA